MNSNRGMIFIVVIGALIVLPIVASAGDTTLIPSLAIQGRYDNNVLFDRTDVIDDYSSIITPALILNYKSERTELDLGGDVAFINYLDQTDLDTIIQDYYLNLGRSMTERLQTNVSLGYTIDTLLESELEQTGRVFDREDRESFYAGGGMDYQLSQKSAMGFSYNFSRVDYQEETRADRNEHDVAAYYSRFFNEGIDSITVKPSYRHIIIIDEIAALETRDVKANSYSLNLGWTHRYSETSTLRLFIGGRYTEEAPEGEISDNEKTDGLGMVADLSYAIEDERSSFQIGYKRDISYDAENDQREVDQLYTFYKHAITERFNGGLRARVYNTRSESEDNNNEDTILLDISPWLDYSLTEKHSLRLTYRYSLEYDETQTSDKTVDRSQITLAVVFKFPNKF